VGIHPETGCRFVGGIEQRVATIVLEPETIAPLEMMAFDLVQPDFEDALRAFVK
jgi:hypothetical protein